MKTWYIIWLWILKHVNKKKRKQKIYIIVCIAAVLYFYLCEKLIPSWGQCSGGHSKVADSLKSITSQSKVLFYSKFEERTLHYHSWAKWLQIISLRDILLKVYKASVTLSQCHALQFVRPLLERIIEELHVTKISSKKKTLLN